MRGGGGQERGGDLSKVYSAAPPQVPSRVGAWALMRDPVELLGRRLKERGDVETGQARRGGGGGLCLCVSGFCLRYWSSFWKVRRPGRAAMCGRCLWNLSFLRCWSRLALFYLKPPLSHFMFAAAQHSMKNMFRSRIFPSFSICGESLYSPYCKRLVARMPGVSKPTKVNWWHLCPSMSLTDNMLYNDWHP